MTRVTNFGRKRTHLQAGLQGDSVELTTSNTNAPSAIMDTESTTKAQVDIATSDSEPPRKKRKRVRKKKPEPDMCKDAEEPADGQSDRKTEAQQAKKDLNSPTKKALKRKRWKEQEAKKKQRRLISSEMRRQKRVNERFAGTTCFACREKGHAAKDCPTIKSGGADDKVKNGGVIGICYRCGSTRHTLSKCKKHVDDSNHLPFASCFVCNGRGHLASSCPQNKEKGIYPNGGSCKLCGEKTHLAKDCDLRKRDNVDTLAVIGTSEQLAADEDDFHAFRRRRQEVEKETVDQEKKRRPRHAKQVVVAGIAKPLGMTLKPAHSPLNNCGLGVSCSTEPDRKVL